MDYLSTHLEELDYFSNDEFNHAQEKLKANMKQKDFFRTMQYDCQKGGTFSDDYSNDNKRRSYYWDCIFSNSNLSNTGFSGSLLKDVIFEDCVIDNTKLDSCVFEGCHFVCTDKERHMMQYLNISKSTMLSTYFNNCYLKGANFTDTVFIDSSFENCTWQSLALENTLFKNTVFDTVVLKKLNFEYSQFENIKINNVRLPFPTIPYIYKGLSYLMKTDDKVFVSSANSKNGQITKDDYLSYLHDLEVFYAKTLNFFPLTNIYISTNRWDKAYASIMCGIKQSMSLHSYRMTYYYCKFLQMYREFSERQCLEANSLINNCMSQSGFHLQDIYSLDRYIGPIRNLLLNEKESSLTIEVLTNIENTEYNKLSLLLEKTDEIINHINKINDSNTKYYVEIRHYCPFSAFFKLFSDPQTLILIAGAIHFAFTGIDKIYSKAIQYRTNYYNKKIIQEELKGHQIDNKIKQEQLKRCQLDNEIKETQLEQNRIQILNNVCDQKDETSMFIEDEYKCLKNNNIVIINGYHHLSTTNNVIKDNDFHYFNY